MARNTASSLAHSCLNTFSELLHKHNPNQAITKFSEHIHGKSLDVVSTNALFYVAHPSGHEEPAKDLLLRTRQTKKHIDFCTKHLTELALQRFKNKDVVVHPLGDFSVGALKSAKRIRFISAEPGQIHKLPVHKLEYHQPISAHNALDRADIVVLEPEAITKEGIVVQKGARLLAELAIARGIPVYAIGTSWHAAPKWHSHAGNEKVPAGFLTGVLSEHGIYAHKDFIVNVKKDFPWII